MYPQRSPTYAQKSPTYTQKSPTYTQKSPTYTQKSPTCTQKSPTYTSRILVRWGASLDFERPDPFREAPHLNYIRLWLVHIGLFCVHVGLFCVYVGLFCVYVGLFWSFKRSFSRRIWSFKKCIECILGSFAGILGSFAAFWALLRVKMYWVHFGLFCVSLALSIVWRALLRGKMHPKDFFLGDQTRKSPTHTWKSFMYPGLHGALSLFCGKRVQNRALFCGKR